MTRRLVLAVLAAAAVLPLAACGQGGGTALSIAEARDAVASASSSPEPASSPATVHAPAATTSYSCPDCNAVGTVNSAIEVAYIAVLDGAGIVYSSEANAVAAGRSVCRYLETGAGVLDAADVATNAGYTPSQAGRIVGAAIAAFCPDVDIH